MVGNFTEVLKIKIQGNQTKQSERKKISTPSHKSKTPKTKRLQQHAERRHITQKE